MSKKRKSYDKKFKSKVALEAFKEESTIQELGNKYGVHPNQIAQWKKKLLNESENIFESKGKNRSSESVGPEKSSLYENIGQLKVENDFLKKKYRELYGHEPNL